VASSEGQSLNVCRKCAYFSASAFAATSGNGCPLLEVDIGQADFWPVIY
jgi:hypothetical protein